MAYRIACIYVEENALLKEVRLEVCNEGSTMQIAPFVRKATVAELAEDGNSLTREFAALLNNLGFEHQPFVLSGEVLGDAEVAGILCKNSYSFIQSGKSRTLKKGRMFLDARNHGLKDGRLLGGTLYINNPTDWKTGIDVRLSYEDAVAEVLPECNDYPLRTVRGGYVKRDAQAEKSLLATLLPYVVDEKGTITLSEYDVDYLKALEEQGWTVMYAKGKGKATKLHFRRTASGIDWFSTAEETGDDITGKLLEAYLHGRHFQQGRGGTVFFSGTQLEKQKEDDFARAYIPDGHLKEKYREETLTQGEKAHIRQTVEREFCAKLHDYQWEGVYWLATMRKKDCGCILADEMGLGKTLQVLAHLLASGDEHSLIIVPTSLVSNWDAEIRRFIPSWEGRVALNCRELDLSKKIHIISYELLRRNIGHYKSLHFDTLVLDEAQVLKNDSTQRHKVISQLDFGHGIVMTGTPIENAVDDVWSYFYIMMPGMRAVHDRLKKLSEGETKSEAFLKVSSKLLNQFILRRTKKEYLKELPECVERNIYVNLSKEEREVYDMVHRVFGKALKDGTSGRVTSIALEALLRLRQACVSVNLLPRTLYKGGRRMSSKMELVMAQIACLGKDDKLIVFSQFVQALEELEGYLKERDIAYVTLYGFTSDRETPVTTFQKDADVKVFLASIKAGGVGLNLTAADYVLLLDDWWNPAVEAQAFSRAHRIGQSRNVEVVRLVCKDTVEEKILALQQQKQQTADVFHLGGGKLSKEELMGLIE